MDKNMINIDDLFRQRLGGAEEKERPGAWLQMRELLDKEMPVQAPGNALNWRRMFGLAAGMLIVASATIGGYRAINSSVHTESKGVAVNTTPAIRNTTPSHTTPAASATSGGSTHANKPNITAKTVVAEKQQQTTTNSANNNKINTDNKVNTATASRANGSQKQQNATASAHKDASFKGLAAAKANKQTAGTVTKSNKTAVEQSVSNNNPAVSSTDNKLAINKKADNNKPVALSDGQPRQTPVKDTKSTGDVTVNEKLAAGNNQPVAVKAPITPNTVTNSNNTATGNKPAQQPKPEVAKNNAPKQLVDKIQTKESYDRKTGIWKQDTIEKGKMEWSKQEPAVAMKEKEAETQANTEITPASAATVNADNEAEKLVPLSNFRVSRKNQNYRTSNIFEEMVKNAKMQLGGVKFYPGLVFGLNTVLSGVNSMSGFQAGVNGNLSLNEKWGIVAELKFVQRFKSGNRESNRNDYMTKLESTAVGPNQVEYSWDSMEHYFTYPAVSSVELPVMLRYSVRRVNLLLGTNFIYNFGFTPGEANTPHRITGRTSTEGYKPAVEPGAILSTADFSSRFGVGYLFGLGYQVSPAIQLDARLTQSLWDNASTPGEEKISKQVYQLPTLQLNFSYRFSSNKYKPYRQY